MGEATRQRALEKLDAFTPKIGYPVAARLSSLRVDANDVLANVRAAMNSILSEPRQDRGQPVDRTVFMTLKW